ncbi:iron-containing redox enzyme family protein [Shewanella pneumatophori]|uniref:Iron-containing redox enzyme family protein n=1 Tax=Shewanella pneumatophori TaxID=314092 RepID=A0A9X1Z9N5_9GAMM|nr:iron-containing redox enzyme family protein [Shewanella pneumatophori]MCL1137513.1 iron-containing redox enzyme family protein [Shewanella pneumatophori]
MADHVLTASGQACLQSLLKIWFDFDLALSKAPIVKRLEQNRLSHQDYQKLLLNLRQQVIEGSRWITRCASSFNRDYADVRSMVIGHAKDEHKDFLLLESDYLATGGDVSVIQAASKNIGSEALHGFLMYRASQENPIDLIGAMWIIEGLGNKMAGKWAELVEEQLNLPQSATRFMRYHGENDEHHLEELYKLVDRVATNDAAIKAIARTAKVVARLYILQLEEIDSD